MHALRNYLRVYRRRWHLTQEELAFLFGYEAESIVSRFESEERAITLAVAIACQTIFGVEPRGFLERLILVFTHFEAVDARDLGAAERVTKVLEGVSNAIQSMDGLPKGQKALLECPPLNRGHAFLPSSMRGRSRKSPPGATASSVRVYRGV